MFSRKAVIFNVFFRQELRNGYLSSKSHITGELFPSNQVNYFQLLPFLFLSPGRTQISRKANRTGVRDHDGQTCHCKTFFKDNVFDSRNITFIFTPSCLSRQDVSKHK